MTIHKHCDPVKPNGINPKEKHMYIYTHIYTIGDTYKNTYYRNWNQHNAHKQKRG